MISTKQTVFFALIALLGIEAKADIEAVTRDGRNVLLKDNMTWEYVEASEGDPSKSAVLSVENILELSNACTIGLRLHNNLGYKIKSLVPRFSVYKTGGIRYESVSKSFSSVKPTRDQYRQIQFVGILCSEIDHIKVHGADHCNMGEIDKFNDKEGQCLSHIYVQDSDLIKISK